jgi:hypothetical protein
LGAREGRRLRPQRLAGGRDRGQLGVEPAELLDPVALQGADVAFHPGQAGRQRGEREREVTLVVRRLLQVGHPTR